ncbi:MAG: hypothetical protein R3B09_21750 [Nannocystaceae bacterium]
MDPEALGEGAAGGQGIAGAEAPAPDRRRQGPGDLKEDRGVGRLVEGDRQAPALHWSRSILEDGFDHQTIGIRGDPDDPPWIGPKYPLEANQAGINESYTGLSKI